MTVFDEKECFGTLGRDMLFGKSPDNCLVCDFFDKCHKMSVAACLQTISDALDLIIQNGLDSGMLKGFEELEKNEDDGGYKH